MSASAGRVLIIPRGEYVAGTTYNMLDLVTYNGSAFIGKRQNVNVTPVDGDDWMMLATSGGVTSFNGRIGAIVPTAGDYSIEQIFASGSTGQIPVLNSNGQLELQDIPSKDTQSDWTSFTSIDVGDAYATSWTSVSPLVSAETHTSIFGKVSQMFKNIRYLYKMLGTTNISSIGNGTVTNAISTINSNLTVYDNALKRSYSTITSLSDLETLCQTQGSQLNNGGFAFSVHYFSFIYNNENMGYGSLLVGRRDTNVYYCQILSSQQCLYGTYNSGTWAWQSISNSIGTIVQGSKSQSVTAATATTVGTITLTPGKWVISAFCDLASSVTGIYILTLGSRTVRTNGEAGGGVTNNLILDVTSTTNIDVKVYSPVAVTARANWTAVRVA